MMRIDHSMCKRFLEWFLYRAKMRELLQTPVRVRVRQAKEDGVRFHKRVEMRGR
jgi:hypothetical protein